MSKEPRPNLHKTLAHGEHVILQTAGLSCTHYVVAGMCATFAVQLLGHKHFLVWGMSLIQPLDGREVPTDSDKSMMKPSVCCRAGRLFFNRTIPHLGFCRF